MILQCRKNGIKIIKYILFKNKVIKQIKHEDYCYINFEHNLNLNYYTKNIIYTYSSLSIPNITYKLNIDSAKLIKLREHKFKNYVSSQYLTKRLKINEDLFVTISYKKSLFNKNGTNPGYLYGYGSYGYNIETNFNKYIISLLDRGYIYGIAHIRGSSYKGYQWYLDGKLTKKKNTFNDFIECTKYLINKKYVDSNNLSIFGGSAGGLLIGAVINKEPLLYKNAILNVPFVDCLTTMLDKSLPLTTTEYHEWGNPDKNKTIYDYILSYSPIDNIGNKLYPNILINTSLNDTRVNYVEPVKYCAKMRDMAECFKNKRKIIMKVDLKSGHSGSSERYITMKNKAFEYAFILNKS